MLGNQLTGRGTFRAAKGAIAMSQDARLTYLSEIRLELLKMFNAVFLTNFDIQKFSENEPKFNGV